jgi:hypothetical protein
MSDASASPPPGVPEDGGEDPQFQAYEQRNTQLHDARVALAQAVSAITMELAQKNRERELALQENRALREQLGAMEGQLRAAHADIAALRGMKVVRWTTRPRRLVYKIRARR